MFTSAGGGGVNKTSEERLSCWPRDWHRPRHRTLSVATMRKRDWPPSWIPPLSLSRPSSTHLRSPDIMQAYLDHVIHFASVSTVLCIFLSLLLGIVRLFSSRRVFGRLWIADAVIMLMCCVTEWCIHTELAVVKCVNVLDRSLASLSSSLKNSRRIFAIRFRLS